MKVTQSPSNKALVFKCQWTFLLLTIQKCYQIMWLKFEDCVEKEGRGWGEKAPRLWGKSANFTPELVKTCRRYLFTFLRGRLQPHWSPFLRISQSFLVPMWSQQLISLRSRACYPITSPSASKVLLVFEISVKYHFLRVNFGIHKDKTRSSPPSFL